MMHGQQVPDPSSSGFVPALPHIMLTSDGQYRLHGLRCDACACIVEGERLACPRCGNRKSLEIVPLATRGRVHVQTVVHRSFPGVKTPFVAVVVDLDDGATVRGTLADVDPLGEVSQGLRVEMVFGDSGQRDPEGRPLVCYCFVPERRAAA